MISTKPYMVRAIHEWCVDNQLTPYLLVKVDANTRVPMAYVKNGEIVLNVNYSATSGLHIDNDAITFSARFNGASQSLYVPMAAVAGIFARENNQGMFFEPEEIASELPDMTAGVTENTTEADENTKDVKRKSHLSVVK